MSRFILLLGLALIFSSCSGPDRRDDDDSIGDDDDSSGDDDDSGGDDDDTTSPGDDDDTTSGSCGTSGGWCTVPSDCGAGQTCYTFSVNQGVCNTDRTVCGGFVGASCADPAASICMSLPGSDYGLCANTTEFDCICNGPAASNFPGFCFPIG